MRVTTETTGLSRLRSDLLVVPVLKSDLSGRSSTKGGVRSRISLLEVNRLLGGGIQRRLKAEGFAGTLLEHSLFKFPDQKGIYNVLFVGWSDEREMQKKSALERVNAYRRLGHVVYSVASKLKLRKVAISGHSLNLSQDHVRSLIEGAELSAYSYTKYKSKKSGKGSTALSSIVLLGGAKKAASAAREAGILSEATCLARDLVNMPARDCTPAYLVRQGRKIATASNVRVQVFDRARLKKMKAGALLSVSDGSQQPPYLLKLVYRPTGKAKKVISLVGKGVTFDSGGLSIKSGVGMMDMKCDMSGAATVLGAMHAISRLKPKVEVRAYVPATENMINGKATRPGDVVRAMNGKTIEVLNTDAEGRLILADALCLAEKDGCDVIVDFATLTGACVVALGSDYAGLFSTDDRLAERLFKSGELSGEQLWRLPLAPEYEQLLKSKVADLKNIGGRTAGAITAALFLKNFVEKTSWAHIDIAGPAFSDGAKEFNPAGGVGFGVRAAVHFVLSHA